MMGIAFNSILGLMIMSFGVGSVLGYLFGLGKYAYNESKGMNYYDMDAEGDCEVCKKQQESALNQEQE